jgi:hypothetical protein
MADLQDRDAGEFALAGCKLIGEVSSDAEELGSFPD